MTTTATPKTAGAWCLKSAPALPAAALAHDRTSWGHNFTNEGSSVELRRVADAVKWACECGAVAAHGLPLGDAARWVIDRLAGMHGLRWFTLDRAGWPRPVGDGDFWGPQVISFWETQLAPKRTGITGLIEWMRSQWEELSKPEDLDAGELAAVAVPAAALAALPWMTNRTDTAGSLAGVCDDGVIEPEGGAWPHKQGESWNDDERVAMFKMRHLKKLTGERIAEIVGVKRQTLDELIGPAKAPTTRNWGKCEWRPSSDLLEECGLSKLAAQRCAVAPLQMVARDLTGT